MKLALLCFLMAVAVNEVILIPDLKIPDPDKAKAFEDHIRNYGRKYRDDPKERAIRENIFFESYDNVKKHNERYNLGLETYTKSPNQFSDMTPKERKAYRKTKVPNGIVPIPEIETTEDTEKVSKRAAGVSVDWRTKGYVNPVVDQGQCGSCWAFTSIAALEGQMFRKTGTLPQLSPQNLVDCSNAYGNLGCDGGWMSNAFNYIKANGGIDTSTSYPYKAVSGTCQYNAATSGAKVTGYARTVASDAALRNATYINGPVSVAIYAEYIMDYKSGVYSSNACPNSYDAVDHGVTLVGFNNISSPAYWILRNSWGPDWGENGYIRMSMDIINICGISANGAYYPTV